MELELQMRHFLVNTEKISFSFFHSPRQHLPHVVSGWTAQSAHPLSPWLWSGLSCASPGSNPVSKPQVCCFLLYLPPRFVLLQALSGYNNCYHSLPRFTPGALHSKWAAPGISHTLWVLTEQLHNPGDECWRAHLPALQASAVNSVTQFNIKNHNLHRATNFQNITQNPSIIIYN